MKSIGAGVALLLLCAPVAAGGRFEYHHAVEQGIGTLINGAQLQVETEGERMVIRYERPYHGLGIAGIIPAGTVLFEGQWHGVVLEGTAYVFACSTQFPYHVTGGVVPYSPRPPGAQTFAPIGALVLEGKAPAAEVLPTCDHLRRNTINMIGSRILIFRPVS
jgi:hypothetical protein